MTNPTFGEVKRSRRLNHLPGAFYGVQKGSPTDLEALPVAAGCAARDAAGAAAATGAAPSRRGAGVARESGKSCGSWEQRSLGKLLGEISETKTGEQKRR